MPRMPRRLINRFTAHRAANIPGGRRAEILECGDPQGPAFSPSAGRPILKCRRFADRIVDAIPTGLPKVERRIPQSADTTTERPAVCRPDATLWSSDARPLQVPEYCGYANPNRQVPGFYGRGNPLGGRYPIDCRTREAAMSGCTARALRSRHPSCGGSWATA